MHDEVEQLLELASKLQSADGQGSFWNWAVTSEQLSCMGDPDGFKVAATLRAPNGEDPTERYHEYLKLCRPEVLAALLKELNMRRASRAFSLDESQVEKAKAWVDAHNKEFHKGKHPYAGAIGGSIGYKFIPTGLGTVAIIYCFCQKGEEGNLTDFDSW